MKYLISFVSRDDTFMFPQESLDKFLESHPDSVVEKHLNNKKHLTVVHNETIERAAREGFDFVVLMHADVALDMGGLAAHIEECKDKYDVMGLCGCSRISVGRSPLNWFVGSMPYAGDSRWGCVTHGEVGNTTSYYSVHSPDVTDHPAACIDGLCIILSAKAVKAGLRFDEELGFGCYDTQISLDAVMTHKLRLGVLVEKGLQHYSVGRSIHTEDFNRAEEILRKRFGFGPGTLATP